MKKFWEWMWEKEYGEGYELETGGWHQRIKDNPYHIGKFNICPTKQMLIGYMIEYLQEKIGLKEEGLWISGKSIEQFYDILVEKIEEI